MRTANADENTPPSLLDLLPSGSTDREIRIARSSISRIVGSVDLHPGETHSNPKKKRIHPIFLMESSSLLRRTDGESSVARVRAGCIASAGNPYRVIRSQGRSGRDGHVVRSGSS